MSQKQINIAKEYSQTLGGRFIQDGPHSGEDFRETLLKPLYESLAAHETLIIALDGSYGYPTSFLEEAFGGLARIHEPEQILERVIFVSEEEPHLIEEIKRYIRDARKSD